MVPTIALWIQVLGGKLGQVGAFSSMSTIYTVVDLGARCGCDRLGLTVSTATQ